MKLHRKLFDNSLIEELENKIELKIITKAPQKWLLIDLEHFQFYRGTLNHNIGKQWEKIDQHQLFNFLENLNKQNAK
jgi:hypothetical protein